jgi:hypothetical protein
MNMKISKNGSTIFLKLVIFFIGILVLAVCIFALPLGIRSELDGDFDYGAIMVGLYVPAIPFFIALYQAIKLLTYIDKNIAFSDFSIKALKNIKYCAIIISALFALGMPYVFYVAERDDAPGVVALGLVIIASSVVIVVFAAVLQKLIQSGMEIKSENDLTV